MRRFAFHTLLTLCGTFSLISQTTQAATPIDALFSRMESANQDVASVAIVQGDWIVYKQYPMQPVEVKAKAVKSLTANRSESKEQSLTAVLVVQMAKKATSYSAA